MDAPHELENSVIKVLCVFSSEATQAMLGQIEQDSSDLSFYKLGFIVLAVSGGIFLLITVSCLIHRKVGLPEVFGCQMCYM